MKRPERGQNLLTDADLARPNVVIRHTPCYTFICITIVSKEIWHRAQEIRKQRRNMPLVGKEVPVYPFTGKIECSQCHSHYLNTEFSNVLAEASASGDQTAYNDRFREIMQAQAELKTLRDETAQLLAENSKTATHIEECIRTVESTPTAVTEWDEAVIRQVVERVTVEVNGGLTVHLKNGAEIYIESSDYI